MRENLRSFATILVGIACSGISSSILLYDICCHIENTPVFSTSFDMRNCGKAAWFIDFRNTRRIDASYEEK